MYNQKCKRDGKGRGGDELLRFIDLAEGLYDSIHVSNCFFMGVVMKISLKNLTTSSCLVRELGGNTCDENNEALISYDEETKFFKYIFHHT